MRLPGRLSAAIEVLNDIEKRKRPVADALKDWGLSHRFAGSGDRAAIGNIVYDALRKKLSNAHVAGGDTGRHLAFATLIRDWGETPKSLHAMFEGDKFAPEPLSDKEIATLTRANPLADAPLHVQADIPEWCQNSFERNFDEEWVAEGQALATRPPVDLRVNTLKANRDKVLKALKRVKPVATEIALNGVRLKAGTTDARTPNVQAEEGYQKGWYEVQDEGSQIVADLIFARPGEKVLDLCAGAGGKSLAMAAAMENKGQIFAYDSDRKRLSAIFERIKRAGAHNIQVRQPDDGSLDDLLDSMDKVVVDAPCTGSGTWRRRPDAKWRLSREQLDVRLREQEEVLSQAIPFVKVGGFLIYITCSVFPEENEGQIYAFLDENPSFELVSAGEVWQDLYGFDKPQPWSSDLKSITLTPGTTNTDGFYFAVMLRNA
ncbi:RsmB/NOP family class I SAM-dependent RNA methyltransferase [Maritalea mediterranea]|uniref:RsmB/NOP family class I SAM-dependent RNA methyltransferase n=1 Tax=Maritalea mediterranea TaxID=2909667 RepID=A0ABS9E9I1_9HYPH|nr:RsmB/NOP family class I SAM-dependent RNA methyltransferase [Maritalea mediterranea]MCF4098058.1 RsmB/NOP family class I SAM-dependent RNA methyltransferase [Maritalea mediterranea]